MNYLEKLFESINSAGLSLKENQEGIEVNTPFAFSDTDEDDVCTDPFDESFKKINDAIDTLNEISYVDYKKDDTQSTKQKLNNSILEINKGLAHAEKLIGHALKLKMEVGANQSIFFKDTFNKFTKIGERMNRLQNKIREFSK